MAVSEFLLSSSPQLVFFWIGVGKCMSRLNVSAMDTRDSKGRGRFFPFVPDQHIFPGKVTKDYWYWQAVYYPPKQVKIKIITLSLFKFTQIHNVVRFSGVGVLFRQCYFFPLR